MATNIINIGIEGVYIPISSQAPNFSGTTPYTVPIGKRAKVYIHNVVLYFSGTATRYININIGIWTHRLWSNSGFAGSYMIYAPSYQEIANTGQNSSAYQAFMLTAYSSPSWTHGMNAYSTSGQTSIPMNNIVLPKNTNHFFLNENESIEFLGLETVSGNGFNLTFSATIIEEDI